MAEAQSPAIAVVLSVSLSVSVGLSISLSAADRLQPHPSLSRGTLPSAPWVRIGGTRRSVLPAGPTASPPRGSARGSRPGRPRRGSAAAGGVSVFMKIPLPCSVFPHPTRGLSSVDCRCVLPTTR